MTSSIGNDSTRPWLASYPLGVPESLVLEHSDMLSVFRHAVAGAREGEAIRYFDGSLTYGDVDELSDAFAVWLAEAGVMRGDRVGIVLQNVPHFLIAVAAAWKLGAIPVPGNPMYKAGELSRIFGDYGPTVVICHDDSASETRRALDDAGLGAVPLASVSPHDFQSVDDARPPRSGEAPIGATADMLALCRERRGRQPASLTLTSEDTGLILYTSGTTGVPKGAVISHGSLAFNGENAARWMRIGRESRILALAPMFHITGFVLHMGLALARGCPVVLHYRFHPEAVLDIIRTARPTFTIAAVTAFNALMNASGAEASDFGSFGQVFTGGAPVAPALREAVRARLGIALYPVYGMTESSAPTHIAPPGDEVPVHPETGALSVGLPISSTDACIAGRDGEPLPPGVAGEIWLRGPQIMEGYWDKPNDTAEALRDGWLRSGDIGVMDEAGWFYVIDRHKDMINASGFKVWPREVEDVLIAHSAVREEAVIGVSDDYRGETVRAYVSLKPGVAEVEEALLIAHCRLHLAVYKVPRSIVFLDDLPKTPTGKLQRAALRKPG